MERGGDSAVLLPPLEKGGGGDLPLAAFANHHAIRIHNAREHNLKSVDVDIPREKFTVITGVSGSGKSTLAFDILFAEGQRRYLESLNAYARQFVQPASRPDVDAIFGIPPTVAIEDLPGEVLIGDVMIRSVGQPHGNIESAGLRFEHGEKSIGYATDFNILTDDMASLYQELDVWVVDALRYRPHPTHPDVPTVLGWIEQLRPRRAALIHMDQSMDYATLVGVLPAGVEPGYDGLEVTP